MDSAAFIAGHNPLSDPRARLDLITTSEYSKHLPDSISQTSKVWSFETESVSE
jgi:hypothetical protein